MSGAGLASLAGCTGSGIAPPGPRRSFDLAADFTRHANFTARGSTASTRQSSVFRICNDTGCSGDGGGVISTDPTAYHVRAVASDGSFSRADYDANAGQITISSSYGGNALNTIATQQNPAADYGTQQLTTYSNGSSLTRTVADANHASGTFVDLQGQVWNVSVYVDGNQMNVTYSGPQSGSVTMSIGDFSYSSAARSTSSDRHISKCSETTKRGAHSVGLAFDAAGLFLGAIGIGAPFGVIAAIIGLGLGLYSYYC